MISPGLHTFVDSNFEMMLDLTAHPGKKIKPLAEEQKNKVKDLDEAINSSFSTLHDGISSMASVMGNVAANDDLNTDLMSYEDMENIAFLIKEMSRVCGSLDFARSNVDTVIRQQCYIQAMKPIEGIENE